MRINFVHRCIAASAGQDRVWAQVVGDMAFFVVADGAGGIAGGAEAAETVIRELRKVIASNSDFEDPQFWAHWLEEVDSIIEADPLTGETTAVVASVFDGSINGASVGDSVAWLIEPNSWKDLTDRQFRRPFLGRGRANPISFSANLNNGLLLLASDGLVNYAPPENLVKIIRNNDLNIVSNLLIEEIQHPSCGFSDEFSSIISKS